MTPLAKLAQIIEPTRTLKAIVGLFIATLLGACASAPGEKFSGIYPPDTEHGDIYLYRTKDSAGASGAFNVMLNDKKVGAIYNASFLHLRVPPGRYNIRVFPPHHARHSDLQIDVEAGKISYYRYHFFPGNQNVSRYYSFIQLKDPNLALKDLTELKSAK